MFLQEMQDKIKNKSVKNIDWISYEGEHDMGVFHGQGKIVFADGSIMEGKFDQGNFLGNDKDDNNNGNNHNLRENDQTNTNEIHDSANVNKIIQLESGDYVNKTITISLKNLNMSWLLFSLGLNLKVSE
jgi:hypothetical protein